MTTPSEALTRSIIEVQTFEPFFAEILVRLNRIEKTHGTISVNSSALMYDPAFVAEISMEAVAPLHHCCA